MEKFPPEVVTRILEYLPFNDRRQMALVNTMFYYASTHPVLLRKEWFLCESHQRWEDFKDMLFKSTRKQFYLKTFHFSHIQDITVFENLTDRIVSLNFDHLIILTDTYFDAITQYCSNLQVLEIKDSDVHITDKERKTLLHLSSISLNNVLFSDFDLNLILKVAPNLKDLGIFNRMITTNPQVIRRFYPSNRTVKDLFTKYNSKDILSQLNIVHHLNDSIRLNSFRTNQNCSILYQIQPIQLELKCLKLHCNDSCEPFNQLIDFDKFKLVLGQYVSLEKLEIFEIPINILSAISKLYNLRHLKLSYTAVDVISKRKEGVLHLNTLLDSIKNMKYIKTLSLYRIKELQSIEPLIKLPIPKIPDCTLKSLVSLDCSLSSDLEALTLGRNLTCLQIRNGEILKVEDLQLLFQNLTNLQHLCIDQCVVLDDEVFQHLPISNLKGLISLKITKANLTHNCLRYIQNSNLKVLSLSKLSIEPCSSVLELNCFARSLQTLSHFIPTLSEFKCHIGDADFRTLDSCHRYKDINGCNLLTYVWEDFTVLIHTYFIKLKLFGLFK